MYNDLLICIDIDGTIANVGNRFLVEPPPEGKTRKDAEYEEWLDKVQTAEKLSQDKPVLGMQQLIDRLGGMVVLVTSRSEKYRELTDTWLLQHNFPMVPLMMRPLGNTDPAGLLKESLIKLRLASNHTDRASVIVIDDDPKGDIEQVCKNNGWSFLKAKSGGIVL